MFRKLRELVVWFRHIRPFATRKQQRAILDAQRDESVPKLSFAQAFDEEIWGDLPREGWTVNTPPMDRDDDNYMPTVVSPPKDNSHHGHYMKQFDFTPEKMAAAKARPFDTSSEVSVVCEDPAVTRQHMPGMELDPS